MYQQRWRSKRFLRGYHGDWIGERRFRRWFLPTTVPRLEHVKSGNNSGSASRDALDEERTLTEQDRMPVTSLFLREVERRLDTAIFRCCFARSAREARALVVQGKVRVNGVVSTYAGTLLNPGDLITIEPSAVPMLSPAMAQRAAEQKAAELARTSENSVEEDSSQAENSTGEVIEGQDPEHSQKAEGSATSAALTEGASEVVAAEETSGEAGKEAVEPSVQNTEGVEAHGGATADGQTAEKVMKKDKGKGKAEEDKKESLAPGVFPFNLPAYAAPFLFIPPYLEVSFTTCSAIYMRHPTITPAPRPAQRADQRGPVVSFHSDLPSPYPATSDIFSLAWELYARDAPRIRSDVRRLRHEARYGRSGLRTARAQDQWRKVLAIRRKRDRQPTSQQTEAAAKVRFAGERETQFVVGGRSALRRRAARPSSRLSLSPSAQRSHQSTAAST